MRDDIEQIILDEPTIAHRVDELASEITATYRGQRLMVLAVLNGSLFFAADLLRRIPIPLEFDVIKVRSYGDSTQSSGSLRYDFDHLPNPAGRHVLIVDDILDSGLTLRGISGRLLEQGTARSIRACVLLRKQRPRQMEVPIDFLGFEIEDRFVVGYGLDYAERYRNLPFIATLRIASLNEKKATGPLDTK